MLPKSPSPWQNLPKFYRTFYFQTVSNMETRVYTLNGAGQFREIWRNHCINWDTPLAVALGNTGCRWNTNCSFMWSLLPDTQAFIACSSALNTTSDLPEVGRILWNALFDHTHILRMVGSSGWAATSVTSAPQAYFWSATVCSRARTSVAVNLQKTNPSFSFPFCNTWWIRPSKCLNLCIFKAICRCVWQISVFSTKHIKCAEIERKKLLQSIYLAFTESSKHWPKYCVIHICGWYSTLCSSYISLSF